MLDAGKVDEGIHFAATRPDEGATALKLAHSGMLVSQRPTSGEP
jgi:hypothetical protein